MLLSDVGERAEVYTLFGPGVTAEVDVQSAHCTIAVEGEQVLEWACEEDASRDVRNGTYAETKAFLEAVQGNRSFGPTLADVIPSLAVAQTVHHGDSGPVDVMD